MFVLQAAMVKGRGGIATAVAHYDRMFCAEGVRTAAAFRGPSAAALAAEGAALIDPPPLLTSPIGAVAPALFQRFKRTVLEQGGGQAPDVLIIHSDLALAALARLFPNAKRVAPCHSDKTKRKVGADLIVTLNQAQDELVRRAAPSVRAARLGNPYVAAPARPLLKDGPPRLNFVARFIATKDPLTLARAAALMRSAPDVRFIGAGPLEAELRAAAAPLGGRAGFPGWLEAPFADFHRNDVLVLPSAWEGLPYLLQEALDHGVAIVASDVAGNRAALNDGAYGALFAYGDASALAGVLDGALGALDALRAKAEKGRAALHARYGAAAFWRALKGELDQIGERRNA